MVYRTLGRDSSARKATLRSLVTHLLEYESITTTHAKAKEAQTAAERLIQLAKNKSPTLDDAKIRALQYIYKPKQIIPKLFGEISERYAGRDGGYTRVLKLEARHGDNAPRSILELVDGPKEMKFALLARTVARLEAQNLPIDEKTSQEVFKVCKNKVNGEELFKQEVAFMRERFYSTPESIENLPSTSEVKQQAPLKVFPNPLLQKLAEQKAAQEKASESA